MALLGAGDDIFQWDPGDGSDIVEGQDGTDTMLFNGANVSENFDVSANGERVRFTRNVGNIVMDLNDVERIDLNALGGADTITVNDLTGTDLAAGQPQPGRRAGRRHGDGQADTVIVNGTNGNDTIDVVGARDQLRRRRPAGPRERHRLRGRQRRARRQRSGRQRRRRRVRPCPPASIKLTIDGGAGNDTLLGSSGADVLLGGDGNDFIVGDNGNDVAFLGAGDDVFQWDPGDGNDTVEGQAGTDTMLFIGSNVSENIDISANGGRVRFFRDVGQRHDGPQRRRADRLQRPRRRRHHHRQRPDRHRRRPRSTSTCAAPRTAAATARPTPSSSTAPTAPTTIAVAGDAGRHHGLGPARLGEHLRRRSRRTTGSRSTPSAATTPSTPVALQADCDRS